jgi:hypothetical protein
MKEQNEEVMEKTWLMKPQTKELKELRKTAEVWETIKRKWTKTLFNNKQQKEALSSQVEALTKEKKDKENVLIDLELINLKSVSMFNSKENLKRTLKVKI